MNNNFLANKFLSSVVSNLSVLLFEQYDNPKDNTFSSIGVSICDEILMIFNLPCALLSLSGNLLPSVWSVSAASWPSIKNYLVGFLVFWEWLPDLCSIYLIGFELCLNS